MHDAVARAVWLKLHGVGTSCECGAQQAANIMQLTQLTPDTSMLTPSFPQTATTEDCPSCAAVSRHAVAGGVPMWLKCILLSFWLCVTCTSCFKAVWGHREAVNTILAYRCRGLIIRIISA